MKKRLLISSVLMSAVLACALGTGTYAWYQADRAGDTVSKATGTSALIETESEGLTVGATDTKVTIVFAGENKDLELTNSAGETYYVDTNGKLHEKTGESVKKVGSFALSATWENGTAPSEDVLAAIEGEEVTFTLGATGTLRLLETNNAADGLEEDETLTVTVKIVSGTPTIVSESERTVYFAVGAANEAGLEDAEGITAVAGGTITAA